MVDTGDILLFRSKTFGPKICRVLLHAHYDHVGICLKYNNGKVVLFEALGRTV